MGLRNLRKEFGTSVAGAETGIRINTDEQEDAIATIRAVCKERRWEMRVWDHITGPVWYVGTQPESRRKVSAGSDGSSGPTGLSHQGGARPTVIGEMLTWLSEPPQLEKGDGEKRPPGTKPVITVLRNFHLAFGYDRADVVTAVHHVVSDRISDYGDYEKLKHALAEYGIEAQHDTGKFLVALMPEEAPLPPELRPLFKVITHELPDIAELDSILNGVDMQDSLTPTDRRRICMAALGLTRLQAEGVFSACSVEKKTVLAEYVWTEKSAILNREGLVNLYTGKEKFDDVVGLTGLKKILKDLLKPDKWEPDNPDLRSKGIALVGPPRTGKSFICKAMGNELGLPVLNVDVGSWFGGIVGDTERNTRKGFQIIRAHAPCIAVIDSDRVSSVGNFGV